MLCDVAGGGGRWGWRFLCNMSAQSAQHRRVEQTTLAKAHEALPARHN